MGNILNDRYDMTKEQNIFNAKRVLVDSIYKQANLEGIGSTFAATQDILNNVNVKEISPKDISKVCCLRDGWKYVFDNIDKAVDLVFIEDLHELIARFDVDYKFLGKLRTDDVMISGTNWLPPLPDADDLHKALVELNNNPHDTDRAFRTGFYIMRQQPFMDGNKRIGSFVINKILIQHGKGIFSVPVELDGRFKEMLVNFYGSGDCTEIMDFSVKHCLTGLHPTDKPIFYKTDNTDLSGD